MAIRIVDDTMALETGGRIVATARFSARAGRYDRLQQRTGNCITCWRGQRSSTDPRCELWPPRPMAVVATGRQLKHSVAGQ